MDEIRKRALGIIAGILVARHLKTNEDLLDNPSRLQWRSAVTKRGQRSSDTTWSTKLI